MDVREKLVELLKEAKKEYEHISNFNAGITNPEEFLIELIANHLISHGVTVQEWISVKDRLPEESGQYIVCCDDTGCPYGEGIWYQSGVVVCAQVDVGVNGGICWEWCENSTLFDLEGIVTHWMPLPQQPKGE